MDAGLSPANNAAGEDGNAQPPFSQSSSGKFKVSKTALVAGALLFAMLLSIGVAPRLKRRSELMMLASEQERQTPKVETVTPRWEDAPRVLVLPATTQAIQEAVIFARSSGYVRRWLVGMGARVRAGQVLAEIDAPETDQQLHEARQQLAEADQNVTQARAELAQAQAGLEQAEATLKQTRTNLELARINLERSKTLVSQGIVSRQDADDKQAIYDARLADVEAAQATVRVRQAAINAQKSTIDSRQSTAGARQANMRRYADLHSFGKVTAPFDGTVTARNLEVGALINENGSLSNGNGLFRIARLDTIRVFINVPQTYVAFMKAGVPVEVEVQELPQKKFAGRVFGTSHSIDPTSRTLMVETRIDNPDQQLYSGMYAKVRFELPPREKAVIIPFNTLLINSDGAQVVIVRPDQTIHYQKVEVGRDLGKEIEIISGLTGDESLVANPTNALREGMQVQAEKTRK